MFEKKTICLKLLFQHMIVKIKDVLCPDQLQIKKSLSDPEKVNVSRQTINSIEIGKYVPSTLLALKIASVLETSVDKLFHLEPEDWN